MDDAFSHRYRLAAPLGSLFGALCLLDFADVDDVNALSIVMRAHYELRDLVSPALLTTLNIKAD
jgi:hypothetical protein